MEEIDRFPFHLSQCYVLMIFIKNLQKPNAPVIRLTSLMQHFAKNLKLFSQKCFMMNVSQGFK